MCMHDSTLECRPSLSPSQIADLRLAALQMSGPKRRAFEAEMTLKYCGGSPLLAEIPLVAGARPWRLAWQRDAPGSFVLVHNRPSVDANAGKTSLRRRPQRFVDSPMRMRSKTRRSARA